MRNILTNYCYEILKCCNMRNTLTNYIYIYLCLPSCENKIYELKDVAFPQLVTGLISSYHTK